MLILEAICHVWKCWQLVIFNPFYREIYPAVTAGAGLTLKDDLVTCNLLLEKIVDTNNV